MSEHSGDVLRAKRLHTDGYNTPGHNTVERRIITLPIEVQEHIISSLDLSERDVRTIAQCALVCRQWLPRSRFELYSFIPLSTHRQFVSFRSLVRQPPSSIAGYLKNVQELYIWPRREGVGWGQGQERPWAHNILDQFAGYFPGLVRISFEEVDWMCAHGLALCSGYSYRSLTTLVLYRCKFTNVAQLHMFVTAFPALADITLWNIELNSRKMLPIPKGGHPLTSLKIVGSGDDMLEVTRWLAGALHLVQRLADLHWSPSNRAGHLKTVTEAIDRASLHKLELWMPEDWPGDLSRFTHLRVLKLQYYIWSLQSHLESVNRVLPSISSDQLEVLDINFWQPYSYDVSFLNTPLTAFSQLKAIDDLLAGPRFAHLRCVALEYDLIIYVQAIPNTSPSPSGGSIVSVPSSSTPPNSSDQLISALSADLPESDLRDPQHSFRLYAEPLVRCKIRDEMKQLDARGILEVKVTVRPEEQEPDTDAGSDEGMVSDRDAETETDASSDGNTEHSAAGFTHSRSETANE